MTKKSKAQKNERLPNSLSVEDAHTPVLAPCAAMTSSGYLLLRRGEPNENQITAYTRFPDKITSSDILQRELQSTTSTEPQDYLRAIERSDASHHQTVWEGRREIAAKMNLPTLEQLAKQYGIPTGSECIQEHPDASDLDKGLPLARLREFLVWDGEYHGTAPEMLDIDVEATLAAAKTRTKGWQPSVTEILESVLHHASTCKKANDTMLVTALKECIAITCVCPALYRSFPLKTESLEELITDREQHINELEDAEGDADSRDRNLEQAKALLKKLEKRQRATATSLREVCAYQKEFAPGKAMPQIVMDTTDKWFTAQFAEGKPVGSIVRVAWLADAFYTFWKQHQSAYLASDPIQHEKQKKAAADGNLGATKKLDEKWRKFTSLFAQYCSTAGRPLDQASPDELQALVDDFGHYLMDKRTKGATDKRSVAKIKNFVSTLVTLMNRNDSSDLIQSTWQELRAEREDQSKDRGSDDFFYYEGKKQLKRSDRKGEPISQPYAGDLTAHAGKKLRSKTGKFKSSAFSTLSLETFKACLKILQDAAPSKNTRSGRGGTRLGRAKKNTRK